MFHVISVCITLHWLMAVAYYSQTSRKGPPKMSSPGGHLRGVVAHESLDDTGFNFASLAYGNCSDLCHA